MKGFVLRSVFRSHSLSTALLLVLFTLNSHRGTVVESCGVTIHNEIAFRASRILLAGIQDTSANPKKDPSTSCSCFHSDSCPHSHPHSNSHSHSHSHSTKGAKQSEGKNRSQGLYDFVPLLELKESLFAGSFFPDWGYNCIGKIWNEAAEEAHWPPFAEAAVRYILETYPKPWPDHTKALITFLFGTVSHSLGDMSWHALQGLDAGFIKALAKTSFDGDYTKGHTLADIGAEFVLSHMSKMDHLVTTWKVPVKDISEIYKRMGYYVPGPALSHCMRNGFAGAQANARLGSQLFPVYASKSPFLIEQVEDYPMGGLRDMSEWTVDCWNGLAGYLGQERKLPDDEDRRANKTFNMCYALWEERTKKGHKDAMKHTREGQVRHQHERGAVAQGASALNQLTDAGFRVLSEVDDETGMVTFSIEEIEGAKHEKTAGAKEETGYRQSEENEDMFSELSPSAMQQPLTWKSHTRKAELHLRQSKSQKSQEGSSVCLSFTDELESRARTLFLPIAYSSFGHAAATGDFDGDGIIDLAVAAPHMTLDPLVPSQGVVFIVPVQSLFVTQKDEPPSPEADTSTDVRSISSRILYGDPDEPQSRFGWSLAVVDLNQDGIDDLAVGAPGHGAKDLKYDGAVYVFFGHEGSGLSEKPDLVINYDRAGHENQEIPPKMDTLAGLGYVLQGLDLTGSGHKDLVIGMPMATTIVEPSTDYTPSNRGGGDGDEDDDEDDDEDEELLKKFKPQAGKVLAFLSQAKHIGRKLDTENDWELLGKEAFGWFGASFTMISQAFHEATCTDTSALSSLLSWLHSSLPKYYGSPKREPSDRKILVVSSPTFGVGEQEAMRGKIQGFVIPEFSKSHFKDLTLVEPMPAPQKIFTIHGDSKFQQLGSSLAPNRIAPSHALRLDRQFPAGVPQELLVVGSQSEDILHSLPRVGRQWQAGMVRILDISRLPYGADVKISDLDANPEIVLDLLQGSQSMAHLSAAMEVSTDGRSLWLTEPYAKAEAGRILEWAPNFEKQYDDDKYSEGDRHRRGGSTHRKDILGVRGRQLVRSNSGGDDDDGDDDNQDRIKQCFIGSDVRGRFGSQLLVEDLNKDGLDDIVVTSSHASQYATMAGTVTIKFKS
ncbi:hypothetical protein EDD21DRAFT_414357 [Dissophora ornata]|nr:Glycosylphosphatidylinositol specific phospholipase D1 [Dissophora ornata]KAI8602027.1 hypothetical protein EDD21DRAFT_414357 [Dissophora ornata]